LVCCTYTDPFTDDVVRIAVIWSSNAVFWEGVVETLRITIGLHHALMLLYGYIGVALIMTVVRDMAENAWTKSTSETVKLAIERTYVALAAVFCIMLWEGRPYLIYRGFYGRGEGHT